VVIAMQVALTALVTILVGALTLAIGQIIAAALLNLHSN
jgi:hypothetical protein